MKTKKKTPVFLIIGIAVTLSYIIFAIRPLNEEFQFTPVWKLDVANPTIQENSENKEIFPFKLAQTMGYFTEDGKITNFITFPYKSSISKNYYTQYRENNTSCEFYSPDGSKIGLINEYGFPFFDNDKLFVFLPGGSSLVELNDKGERIWKYEGSSPITAFDSKGRGIVAGFADGSITQFNEEGQVIQQFSPGGSSYPVISGAAVSSNGEYIASISGQEKERFVLSKKEDAHSKIVFHEFSELSTPLQKLVQFSQDDSKVFFNFDKVLGIVDLDSLKAHHIKIKGQAISIKESQLCTFVLTKAKNTYSIYILEKNSHLIGSFSFQANSAFIQTDKESLYLGKDTSISKIAISKK